MQEAEACRAFLLHSGMQVCYELMCSMVHNNSTAKKGPLWHIRQRLWHIYIYIYIFGSYNAMQSACTLAALCCLNMLYSHMCSQVINKLVMTSRRKTQWPLGGWFWRHASRGVSRDESTHGVVQMKMHMTALWGKLSF